MIFWEQVSHDLIDWGFNINLYDWYITNKMIDGKQCTNGWNVDRFMITHVDPQVNSEIIKRFKDKYWKLYPLVVHCGPVHYYPVMNLDFYHQEKVIVTMIEYIENIIKDMAIDFAGES